MPPVEEEISSSKPDLQEEITLMSLQSKELQKLAEEIVVLIKQDLRIENERNGRLNQ